MSFVAKEAMPDSSAAVEFGGAGIFTGTHIPPVNSSTSGTAGFAEENPTAQDPLTPERTLWFEDEFEMGAYPSPHVLLGCAAPALPHSEPAKARAPIITIEGRITPFTAPIDP
jgi:hypothetical protein